MKRETIFFNKKNIFLLPLRKGRPLCSKIFTILHNKNPADPVIIVEQAEIKPGTSVSEKPAHI